MQYTIMILVTNAAILTPLNIEIRDLLTYAEHGFVIGGPLGYRAEDRLVSPVDSESGNWIAIPLGLISAVQGRLEELGHQVQIDDKRNDSPRWGIAPASINLPATPWSGQIEAIGNHRTLRIVARRAEQFLAAIVEIAITHLDARIAVAVTTKYQSHCFRTRLRGMLNEPIGIYTTTRKEDARICVGTSRQLPRAKQARLDPIRFPDAEAENLNREFDVLILPFAEETATHANLEYIQSIQFRRIVAFTQGPEIRDADVRRRLLWFTEYVWDPCAALTAVTAIFVNIAGGAMPDSMMDALEEKRRLYWHHRERNVAIAALANGLAHGKCHHGAFGDRAMRRAVLAGAERGVAILVESLPHARELQTLLPLWPVWSSGCEVPPKPAPGCGVIATELGASEFFLSVGVLIRATGTRFSLADTVCRWPSGLGCGYIVDLIDDFHPIAAANAAQRRESYEQRDYALWPVAEIQR